MSKYIEDVQGKIVSNPINETNTKYAFNEKRDDGHGHEKYHNDNYPLDTQYMINGEPVSDIDTAYYDDYRNKIEELRKRTESTYEALESCLVPAEIPGMSFQPYEFKTTESEDGEVTKEKFKSFTYFFQDHLSPISADTQEYVFRTNKVKFIDDRHRRLIYDRTVHLMSLKEDEDNGVTFKEMLYRTFFDYYDNTYFSLVREVDATVIEMNRIMNNIINDFKSNKEKYVVYDENGNEKYVESTADFDLVLQCGQDIDTHIPSTLHNLYNMGWVNAAVIFLNGIIIPWTKIILSVDRIDTFIIVSNINPNTIELLDDDKEIFLDYVHIPFKVEYLVGPVSSRMYKEKYFPNDTLNKDNIFIIDKYGGVRFESKTKTVNFKSVSLSSTFDRIICVDPNIKYAEFTLGDDNENLKDVGIEYTKSFKDFCGNDYRCKLKQFNFLGFEFNKFVEKDANYRGMFKNDDYTVTWHPFNIMDIRFKRLFNRERIFKVFYNTKVLYDQDNILRIKNHDRLLDEYEKYRQDVTANIETYMNEVYLLAKKDIGTYIATDGKMYGYKFHYVTPFECFMLYNVLNHNVYGNPYTSFDDFRNINVATMKTDTTKFKTHINPELTANSDGKCVWALPIAGNKQRPAIEIKRISNGEIVLADVNFDSENTQVIITMNNQGNDIPAGTYRVTMYYADYIIGNPELTPINNKCSWSITNVKGDASVTTVYNSSTNQVVLTDIQKTDDSITITINSSEVIPADSYIAVINQADTDTHSILNYLNGGFVAVPVDEESMFMKLVKEKDIYDGDVVRDDIKAYFQDIVSKTNASLPDILIPIDNEKRTDRKAASNAFYLFEGDTKGKIIPFMPTFNEFGLEQEFTDARYDVFKLRFEMSYLNNMEEGATPVDEFIYYFDNDNLLNFEKYPVVSDYKKRRTALALNALAKNIFKRDPANVYESIEKMNWSADYIIPKSIPVTTDRSSYITSISAEPSSYGYNYRLDPRFFYNFGYYEDSVPHKLVSEWGLRRNLPEMFYWSLDENEYTIDSMHLLDEVFDFTYDFNKTYEENLKDGVNYVIGYDADKLEQSIKRSIVSMTKSGEELKTHINNSKCVKHSSLGGFKLITFVKNKNQKIAFDNTKIKVILARDTIGQEKVLIDGVSSRVMQNYDGGTDSSFSIAYFKHNSQENYTVTKFDKEFTDVDKSYTQEYDSMYYNRKTELLEFYKNNELVITLQVDEIIDMSRLQMSRWNIGQQYNYVMIFKNRELYDKYNTIEYDDISFSVEFDYNNTKVDDQFEFIFFLNANNTIMKKICETDDDIKLSLPSAYYSYSSMHSIRTDINGDLMDKGLYETLTDTTNLSSAIPCNTSILDAENVQLLVNEMPSNPDDEWSVSNTDNTSYELSFRVKSYRSETYCVNEGHRIFKHTLKDDEKLNGLHRVTKQGGGEYILEFDGKVPEKEGSGEGGGGIIINPGFTGLGLGLMSLATKNVNSIKFNGTPEQWESISKQKPWIRSVINIHGGIQCLNGGRAEIYSDETEDGTNTLGRMLSLNEEE